MRVRSRYSGRPECVMGKRAIPGFDNPATQSHFREEQLEGDLTLSSSEIYRTVVARFKRVSATRADLRALAGVMAALGK